MPVGGLLNVPRNVTAASPDKLAVACAKLNIKFLRTIKFFDIQPNPEGGWIAFYYHETNEDMQMVPELLAKRGTE